MAWATSLADPEFEVNEEASADVDIKDNNQVRKHIYNQARRTHLEKMKKDGLSVVRATKIAKSFKKMKQVYRRNVTAEAVTLFKKQQR